MVRVRVNFVGQFTDISFLRLNLYYLFASFGGRDTIRKNSVIPKTVQMDLVVYNLLNTAARTLGLHRRQVCLLTLSLQAWRHLPITRRYIITC